MEAWQGIILPEQRRNQDITHFNIEKSNSYRKNNTKHGPVLDKGQSKNLSFL